MTQIMSNFKRKEKKRKKIRTARFLNLSSLPWESCLFLLKGGGAVPPFSSFLEVTMPDVLGNEGGGAMGVFWPFLGTSEAGEPDELGLASADFLLIAPNTEEAIEFSLKPKIENFSFGSQKIDKTFKIEDSKNFNTLKYNCGIKLKQLVRLSVC